MDQNNLLHEVAITAIVVKDGKYLITRRSLKKKRFPGKWTVPGGKLEVLDYALKEKDSKYQWYNVLENLGKREVEEEVGLKIKNIGYITSLVFIRPDNIPALVVSLSAETVDDVPIVLDKALTEYAWVTIEEAKNYDLIEGIYEELEMLEEKSKTGSMKEWKKTI